MYNKYVKKEKNVFNYVKLLNFHSKYCIIKDIGKNLLGSHKDKADIL